MALGKDKDRLSRLAVFACLDADALHLIAFSAETRSLAVGETLFRRGEAADTAVLLVSGTLTLEGDASNATTLRIARPGTLLCESALLAPGQRTATVVARDASIVTGVSRSLMLRVLQAYPDNAGALRGYWAMRLARRVNGVRSAVRP